MLAEAGLVLLSLASLGSTCYVSWLSARDRRHLVNLLVAKDTSQFVALQRNTDPVRVKPVDDDEDDDRRRPSRHVAPFGL